jgi:hypothetical protein
MRLEKMGTDHVFMKGAKRRPEKRGLSPIFCYFLRAFADVRRALAKEIGREGFGIVCRDPGKPDNKSLISVIMRLVA